jgi:hypothetical protein
MGAFTNLPDGQHCVTAHKRGYKSPLPAAEVGSRCAPQVVHPGRSHPEELMAAFTVDFDDFFLDQMLVEVVASLDEGGPSWLQETHGA